ncbi:hypothetical protein ABID26_001723 [Mesorhizobium shonense]|uniref:Uncharacterized protein n=1 Tax=Mesorhizobium shonense TaxID=1209948 RepID=A0ABV2HP52_9HYPH
MAKAALSPALSSVSPPSSTSVSSPSSTARPHGCASGLCNRCSLLIEAGAAPHLPAGIFSPWNGEKGLAAAPAPSCDFRDGETVGASVFLPVTIRGEMPGRAMRGGADVWW